MSHSGRLVTSEELAQLRDDEARFELVEGRLIQLGPVGIARSRIVVQMCALLHRHVHTHGGAIVTDVGFKLTSDPDTVRVPDIAFLRVERAAAGSRRGVVSGRPDVVFEILSPDDVHGGMRRKIDDYLSRGVAAVVVIDPAERSITAYRQIAVDTMRIEDMLDLSDVMANFRCRVRDVFA
jgi:Uma2 family endonuclease